MVKNFNNFINEKKSEIDDIFSSINKHIAKHSANTLKKLLTRDGQKKVANPDLRKAIYYLYDNGIVKKISVNKIHNSNIEYFIVADSESGIYDTPEKVVEELQYNDFMFKDLKKLVSTYNLNKKEIDYKLSQKLDGKVEEKPIEEPSKEVEDTIDDSILNDKNKQKLSVLQEADSDNKIDILYDGDKAQVIGVMDNINIIYTDTRQSTALTINDEHLNKIKIL